MSQLGTGVLKAKAVIDAQIVLSTVGAPSEKSAAKVVVTVLTTSHPPSSRSDFIFLTLAYAA